MFLTVRSTEQPNISICQLGVETNSKYACWGPGIRDKYILHYVLKGKGYYNGKPVLKGQGFFIKENSLHEYHSSTDDPWEYFFVVFSGSKKDVEQCFQSCDLLIENYIFDIKFFQKLLILVKEIVSEKNGRSQTIPVSCALSWFYKLISLHEEEALTDSSSASDRHVHDAIRYMENNYHTNIKITDVAEYVSVADRYLYNLFIKNLGISPKAYLTELRMKRAYTLLTKTKLPISAIGDSVGYNDVLAFSVFFKKHAGVSPGHYRKTGDGLRRKELTDLLKAQKGTVSE